MIFSIAYASGFLHNRANPYSFWSCILMSTSTTTVSSPLRLCGPAGWLQTQFTAFRMPNAKPLITTVHYQLRWCCLPHIWISSQLNVAFRLCKSLSTRCKCNRSSQWLRKRLESAAMRPQLHVWRWCRGSGGSGVISHLVFLEHFSIRKC